MNNLNGRLTDHDTPGSIKEQSPTAQNFISAAAAAQELWGDDELEAFAHRLRNDEGKYAVPTGIGPYAAELFMMLLKITQDHGHLSWIVEDRRSENDNRYTGGLNVNARCLLMKIAGRDVFGRKAK